jgi:hypothetical protein
VVRARWAVAVFVVEKLHENSARERERDKEERRCAARWSVSGGARWFFGGGIENARNEERR